MSTARSLACSATGCWPRPRRTGRGAFRAERHGTRWIAAPVPGTVAQRCWPPAGGTSSIGAISTPSIGGIAARSRPAGSNPVPAACGSRGWPPVPKCGSNGERILNSDNMFQAHVTDVTLLLQETNDLVICFRALTRALAARRPRPRWKTRLVSHQQLRFIRTSSPGTDARMVSARGTVGPWRAISLELWRPGTFTDLSIQPRLEGGTGVVEVSAFAPHAAEAPVAGTLSVGHVSAELRAEPEREGSRLSGQLRIDDPARWWPHTHGAPRLYPASARLVVNGEVTTHDCGGVGFRDVRAFGRTTASRCTSTTCPCSAGARAGPWMTSCARGLATSRAHPDASARRGREHAARRRHR